jgi:hypothetical protein
MKVVRLFGFVGCALLVLGLAGCTNVKGEYACQGGLLDSLTLESGGKATASATMLGIRQVRTGTYTVDGDKVNVVINGSPTTFTLTDKTLDGGQLVGKCTLK